MEAIRFVVVVVVDVEGKSPVGKVRKGMLIVSQFSHLSKHGVQEFVEGDGLIELIDVREGQDGQLPQRAPAQTFAALRQTNESGLDGRRGQVDRMDQILLDQFSRTVDEDLHDRLQGWGTDEQQQIRPVDQRPVDHLHQVRRRQDQDVRERTETIDLGEKGVHHAQQIGRFVGRDRRRASEGQRLDLVDGDDHEGQRVRRQTKDLLEESRQVVRRLREPLGEQRRRVQLREVKPFEEFFHSDRHFLSQTFAQRRLPTT